MNFTWLLNLILVLIFPKSNFPAVMNTDAIIIKTNPVIFQEKILADKSAVLSVSDRVFLYTKKADEVQPIASITKLMTALVFLDNNPGWDSVYKITLSDKIEGGKLNLFQGDSVKIKDLFHTSLIASDNGATIALVKSTGLSEKEFVLKMNEKARFLGLRNTDFVDPTGLSDNNISSAKEVALLAQEALSRTEISEATRRKEYEYETLEGRNKKIESTDYLLFDTAQNDFQVLGGKTGYTEKAGYCFVGKFKDKSGRELISVILNSDGKNDRFKESKTLVDLIFKNYFWKK